MSTPPDRAGSDAPGGPEPPGRPLDIDAFAGGEPTRELPDWHRLWSDDRPFPIRSHRGGFLGRLLVAGKRLFRTLVKTPQADLWDRQRVFNVVLLEFLIGRVAGEHERRLGHLESFVPRALADLLRHDEALFARVDQKLDRYRRDAEELLHGLGAALAAVEGSPPSGEAPSGAPAGERGEAAGTVATLARFRDEEAYLAFERRFRGTEEEVRERLRGHLPHLAGVGELGDVLDLGCGRGEALAVLAEAGLPARGVDSSAAMVARCRERGLRAEEGDLFEALAGAEEGSLGAVVSFHVVEHLPPTSLDHLARLAWRALAPGGVLLLETPNPLSVVVAARSFWLDPTHRRPVHPDALELLARQAGFEPVERHELRPFPAADRLPEIDLQTLPEDQRPLADQVNRLRDLLDDLLFGNQDYAIVARKPASV
ncbi:MAG TPA: methyltransferase domain-containing protein [Thermoanaerobaculia bacterium]|nr:methyltransferase domain-containing protein [Thermoanaerobaculia bacterium]